MFLIHDNKTHQSWQVLRLSNIILVQIYLNNYSAFSTTVYRSGQIKFNRIVVNVDVNNQLIVDQIQVDTIY